MINYELISEVVNKHLLANGHSSLLVTPKEFEWQNEQVLQTYGMLCPGEPHNDFCTKLFNLASEDHSDKPEVTLFHYKDAATAIRILDSMTLQVSHLSAQVSKKDEKEFRYFMEQIGHELAVEGKPIPEKLLKTFGGFLDVDTMRDDAYAISFSRSDMNPRCWDEHADMDSGVCFKMKYRPQGNRVLCQFYPLYTLRDMIYDNEGNNRFAFLAEINEELIGRLGYGLMITAVPEFAKFYKRNNFAWEDEIRFAVDIAYLRARNIEPGINIHLDGQRKFFRIPLKGNELFFGFQFPFELELVEIQCGGRMTVENLRVITQIASQKYPSVPVRYRS